MITIYVKDSNIYAWTDDSKLAKLFEKQRNKKLFKIIHSDEIDASELSSNQKLTKMILSKNENEWIDTAVTVEESLNFDSLYYHIYDYMQYIMKVYNRAFNKKYTKIIQSICNILYTSKNDTVVDDKIAIDELSLFISIVKNTLEE